MKIVAISDTHNRHEDMRHPWPEGDVLVHAGDMTDVGYLSDVLHFAEWSKSLPYKHKVIIAGNHDFCFDRLHKGRYKVTHCPEAQEALEAAGWHYLEDSQVEIDGKSFYGSPHQPWFHNWAFNLPPEALEKKWALIPDDVDVLITHGPPNGILDLTERDNCHVGCQFLKRRVDRIEPAVHIFGHIHEGYGIDNSQPTRFVNASTCDLQYAPVNPPIVIEL